MDAKLITREYLLSLVTKTTFRHNRTTTYCTLEVGGMPIVGESHCAFKEQYVKSVGEKVSYENALVVLRQYELYAAMKIAQLSPQSESM